VDYNAHVIESILKLRRTGARLALTSLSLVPFLPHSRTACLRMLSNLLSSLCVYFMRAWAEAASPHFERLVFGGALDTHGAGSRAHLAGPMKE